MRSVRSSKRYSAAAFAVLHAGLGLLVPTGIAMAQATPAEMSAQWEQWANSIPTSVNPQVDPTGAKCMVGQRGGVWLLAGTFFGGSAIRSCSIPEETALFFPVVNNVEINAPKVCGQGAANMSVESLRQTAASAIDAAANLHVEVDGKPNVAIQRIQSVVFAVALPADNVFNSVCGGPGSVPPGIYSPAVDDGYYVALEPLKPGKHTLHIHAEGAGFASSLDVTFNLTVVRVLGR